MKEWWHRRTDGVEGIDKLIGERGSHFRQNVVYPGAALVTFAVAAWVVWRREP